MEACDSQDMVSFGDMCKIRWEKKLHVVLFSKKDCGKDPESLGCKGCKPTIGNITAFLFDKHIFQKDGRTNERFVDNIQRRAMELRSPTKKTERHLEI